ncbi:lantibiotic immunity ABC transporter MutE/EpiE family permease subunit [Clostridium oryzae]|uniref:ABC-2 family transporter protein n=1 Tax=Clostridium oryzae TaxID=1450648 RepID=A0A1V4IWM6_9CLOT|nr:lantibiotic immunity ABC transporter MutE/EpiE family permease subunit [Clostridium oryzae]OPJ64220.1 ABC-2 family transporter protein [Clostridium oryzae]
MKRYLQSELLKTKGSILRKLLILVPIVCICIAYMFSFLGGDIRLTFLSSMNHWGLLWMPALIMLLCGMFHTIEQNDTGYKTIFSFPIDLKRSWIAKNMVIAAFTFIASIALGVIFVVLQLALIHQTSKVVPFYSCFAAILISWLVSLWQIPLCLWLSKRINVFVLMIIGCAANLELGAGKAPSSLWWLDPWTYPLRLQVPILHTHPNGLILKADNILINFNVIPIGIALGLLLFIVLTILTSVIFANREVIS